MDEQATATADKATREYELRLKCLELAHGKWKTPLSIAAAAFLYADFLRGTNDAELARAARALNDKIDEDADTPEHLKPLPPLDLEPIKPFVPLGQQFQ
ncbi:MAG: hypothetical protein V3U60_16600 [Gammaproteobacteria bacterium]